MRSKEEANDYRYFPDPDLTPVEIDQEFIETIAAQLPELPDTKKARFVADYNLKAADAEQLVADQDLAAYFEAVFNTLLNTPFNKIANLKTKTQSHAELPQLIANWVLVELGARLNKDSLMVKDSRISSQQLANLIVRIVDGTISGKIAKTVFDILWQDGGEVDKIIAEQGLQQVTDSEAIASIVAEVIAQNTAQVEQYQAANADKKPRMLGFFVGQVMKKTQGKANPKQVNEVLLRELEEVNF